MADLALRMFLAIAAAPVLAACGDDGGGAADAGDAAIDSVPIEGALLETALTLSEAAVPTVFDVVPDLTGDGRDDVIAMYFTRDRGPELVVLRLVGDRLERVASIEGGQQSLTAPRALVADVIGDARAELVLAHPWEGDLRAFATPLTGDRSLGDAVATLAGPRNSFFATAYARGPLLAGGADAIAIATPGEPEEACFSSEAPVLLRRPWPATGTVAAAAAAQLAGGDPFDCMGIWMTGDRDWTGDGTADLVVATGRGGARLFPGPITDGQPFTGGLALAVANGPYGGYGIAAGAVIDLDGDGALDLALVDHALPGLRVWTAPIDPARFTELILADAAPVLIDGPRPADLDGDGDDDLAVLDQIFNPTRITVLALPGPADTWTTTRGAHSVRTGDLDGDHRAELLALDNDGFRLLRVP